MITGAFSLIRQAINLGYLPRMEILFTSETNTGQIFVPVNLVLFLGVIFPVITFGSSDLASTAPWYLRHRRHGRVTSIMTFEFVRARWNWSVLTATAVLAPLFMLELIFLGANLIKIYDGGYIPVLIATTFVVIMWTWRRGSALLMEKTCHTDIPLASFISWIERAERSLAGSMFPAPRSS